MYYAAPSYDFLMIFILIEQIQSLHFLSGLSPDDQVNKILEEISKKIMKILRRRGLFFPTCKLTCTFTCNVSRILRNDRKNLKFCETHVLTYFFHLQI